MEMIGFEQHDHDACTASTLATAESYCRTHRLQFTPTRRRVLEFLIEEHKALGAYDLLARLSQEGLGTQPPVVYRALDFLLAHGFIHKIERLNAYAACTQPLESHTPIFMICRACQSVAEAFSSLSHSVLGKAARQTGFRIEQSVIEARGLCPNCIAAGVV